MQNKQASKRARQARDISGSTEGNKAHLFASNEQAARCATCCSGQAVDVRVAVVHLSGWPAAQASQGRGVGSREMCMTLTIAPHA